MTIIVKINGQYLCERQFDSKQRKSRYLSKYPYSWQLKRFKRLTPREAQALAEKWNYAGLETFRLADDDIITDKVESSGVNAGMFIINGKEVF